MSDTKDGDLTASPDGEPDNRVARAGQGLRGFSGRTHLTEGEKAYFSALGLDEEAVRLLSLELEFGFGSVQANK